jgi:hypothetical protein
MRIENAHISSSPLIHTNDVPVRFRIITAKWQGFKKNAIRRLRLLGFAALAGSLFAIQPMQARSSIPTQQATLRVVDERPGDHAEAFKLAPNL